MKTMAALFVACSLMATGATAQIADFTPQTPLIGALLHNDLGEATRLLHAGADPNEGRFVGFPSLFLAVMRGDLPLLRLMVARGADLTARDSSGSTALMWGAFEEHGDPSMVDELLRMGADPLIVNRTGETALTWAMRRGDTPIVAALRRAGATDRAQVSASVEKALALLQKSGEQFARVSGCASCHHQSLPQMAIGIARSRGLTVDEPAVQAQADAGAALMQTVIQEALINRDRIPDTPISVSYTLLGFAAVGRPRDELTGSLATVVAAWQSEDGAFHALPGMRPPIESNDVAATALSLRALQLYGVGMQPRIDRAREWLQTIEPMTTEERAMRVLGLAWAKAPARWLEPAASALLALQRPDGGWGQLPGLESDAYATGQAMVALQAAGQSTASGDYRRGLGFLLRTQYPDGSWLVRTRTFPVQPPKDSGFPHGKHQWISAAGTSWASMAIALSLPAVEPVMASH